MAETMFKPVDQNSLPTSSPTRPFSTNLHEEKNQNASGGEKWSPTQEAKGRALGLPTNTYTGLL